MSTRQVAGPAGPESRLIHVAAGAVTDPLGRVLVTRRPDHVHQGGLWEFPGGKLEPGETPVAGLARELREELGIEVRNSRPLIRIGHDYGDRRILLDVHRVASYSGEPHGREGQPLDWLLPEEMDPARFPEADRPVITALRLPERYLITGHDPTDVPAFLARLKAALERGIRLVQLRAHSLSPAEYGSLAGQAHALCRGYGACLLLNTNPEFARDLPCDGLHLTGRRLASIRERPTDAGLWVGASCHDATDLDRAASLGLDYALLSPVLPTASHPGAAPLGWERFAALADSAVLPIYALGGLAPADLQRAIAHGAQGIASIRGFWPGA